MPLNPGNNTVTFIVEEYTNTPDRLGVTGPVPTPHSVSGCNMQPVTESDKIANTMYSEATWKCIAPATSVTQTVKAEDMLTFNSDSYRIIGPRPYYDTWGRLHHITFMCKEEKG